jgi:hypothetical protein
MHLFLAIRNLPAIPVNLIEFSPNDQNTPKLFVSIKRTNIYIPSYKYVLNRLYPWRFDSIHSHCHDDVIQFLIFFKNFPCREVSRCRYSYTCNKRTSIDTIKKTQFDSEQADNYDRNKRKNLLKELEDKWEWVHAFRLMQSNANTCDVFFVIEAMAYLSLQTAKANRYVDRKPMYQKDHVQEFHSHNLDESCYSQVNGREFRMQYRMNCSSFKKLHGLIKDHPIFNKREKGQLPTLIFTGLLGNRRKWNV